MNNDVVSFEYQYLNTKDRVSASRINTPVDLWTVGKIKIILIQLLIILTLTILIYINHSDSIGFLSAPYDPACGIDWSGTALHTGALVLR